jgi:hypothetical protein
MINLKVDFSGDRKESRKSSSLAHFVALNNPIIFCRSGTTKVWLKMDAFL